MSAPTLYSSLRHRMSAAIAAHLDGNTAVAGYPVERWERGRALYRVWDGHIEVDAISQTIIDSLVISKELRCGTIMGVDDPIDAGLLFSAQHRYVTGWIDPT